MKHIATSSRRLAAETGGSAGEQPAGPTQNGVAQGQCTFDVVSGIAAGMVNNAGAIAGAAAGIAFGGSPAGIVGGAVGAAVSTAQAAIDSFSASQACQELDNAALANELGIGAIQAP